MIPGLHVLKLYLHCYEEATSSSLCSTRTSLRRCSNYRFGESGGDQWEEKTLYRIGMSFYLEHYREFVSEEVSATNLDIAMSYT
jgi:hypothetical protein